jgi:hypothetical protein
VNFEFLCTTIIGEKSTKPKAMSHLQRHIIAFMLLGENTGFPSGPLTDMSVSIGLNCYLRKRYEVLRSQNVRASFNASLSSP